MSIPTSQVNAQSASFNRVIAPRGVSLGSSPSITPYAGSLGYDTAAPSSLWIGDGSSWNRISGNGGGTTGPTGPVGVMGSTGATGHTGQSGFASSTGYTRPA